MRVHEKWVGLYSDWCVLFSVLNKPKECPFGQIHGILIIRNEMDWETEKITQKYVYALKRKGYDVRVRNRYKFDSKKENPRDQIKTISPWFQMVINNLEVR